MMCAVAWKGEGHRGSDPSDRGERCHRG